MSNTNFMGGESAATRAAGRDVDALGPSDTSDSGSDVQGERSMATGADLPDELGGLPVELGSDSDSTGTGERGAATGDAGRDGADILPDRIIGGEDGDEPYAADSDDEVDETLEDGDEDIDADDLDGVAAGNLDDTDER